MRKKLDERLEQGQPIQRAVDNTRICYELFIKRIKKRFEVMLAEPFCYLVTFTISPENYDLKKETFVKKIKEALAGASSWVFNEDYGGDNQRLHFHAVAAFKNKLDYSTVLAVYQYGSVHFRLVIDKNEKALREYILKLVNHSVKSSSGNIYRSRRRYKNYD